MSGRGPKTRLPATGLAPDAAALNFTFDGRAYAGLEGDTLASALLANGVRLVGRSFKYHRPRGVMTAGSEEPNALVELRGDDRREPNTKATTIELYDGLQAASQNRWPSLNFDLLAVNDRFSPMFKAGFYYKTFMWPAWAWEKLYEPIIRRAAGLGRAAGGADPDVYDKVHAFCDVLVIGAGPAGLAAALAAGRAGAQVILADEDFSLGGRLASDGGLIEDRPAHLWTRHAAEELQGLANVRVLSRTSVFGVYDGGVYGAVQKLADHRPAPAPHQPRQAYWKIVARRAVLCAGATERTIAFAHNDRPGVMTAGAVRTYLNRFGVAAGRRTAVFTCCDDGWRTARDLIDKGLEVAAVIDPRPEVGVDTRALGVRTIMGGRVLAARGARSLSGVEVAWDGGAERLNVDVLAVSGGWNPTVALTTHLGGAPRWNETLAAFTPGDTPPGLSVAGAAAGALTLGAALRQGAEAGAEAAAQTGFDGGPVPVFAADDEPAGVSAFWRVADSAEPAFLDMQHDVTVKDVILAEQEGFRSVEHLKRYTTLGMATDQGRMANTPGLAIMAELTGRSVVQTGATRARAPFTPVALGALASRHIGRSLRPTRLTPSHAWAAEQGAVFIESGLWLRAQYYPRPGESGWLEPTLRECRAVRGAVGVCDVSTLGKIDVQGADAAVFLDRLYANAMASLAIGKARYGVMLREDGFVMDDGTVSRLGETHFFVTTTTAGAERVMQHMEFCHQVHWPHLDVQMTSVTDHWAQFSVAGPRARDLLARVLADPLDDAAFPYMAAGAVTLRDGTAGRLYRVSFSGELAYEIAVPSRLGDGLIRRLMQAGADLGVAPYGLEALSVLRIEKGHVAGGELNGRTTLADLGLGRMASTKKDYIGRVLAARPGLTDPDRPSLVGLTPVDPKAALTCGAHLLEPGAAFTAANDLGHISSTAQSALYGRALGLGFVRGGAARIGQRLIAWDGPRDRRVEVEIRHPVVYDPEGARVRG